MKSLVVIALLCGLATARVLKILNEMDSTKYADCQEIKDAGYNKNGTYLLTLNHTKLLIPCEFRDNYVYMYILRRRDGQESFERNYNDYRRGFGHTMSDFWVGLDHVHKLTSSGNSVLDVHILDWTNKRTVVTYYKFGVASHHDYYRLRIGDYEGDLKDDLSYNNGMKFYTLDKPDPNNCVNDMRGGWWYDHCTKALPTGHYYRGEYTPRHDWADGIFWMDYHSPNYSLKRLDLTIRRR